MTHPFQIQMLQEALIRLCSKMSTLAQANEAFRLAGELLIMSKDCDLNPISEAIYGSVLEKRNRIMGDNPFQEKPKRPSFFPVREKSDQGRAQAASAKRNPERWARKRRLGDMAALSPEWRDTFTEGERAVLYIIAADCREQGSCRCTNKEIGDRAGVGLTTTRNALRKARQHGLLNVRIRIRWGAKNLANIVTLACKRWIRWLVRFRPKLGFNFSCKGVKKVTSIETFGKKRTMNLKKNLNLNEKFDLFKPFNMPTHQLE
ncbi:hypothetical protein [Xenorhabdus bovienii]|uniref:hypothetical protein n=1 Tax=Xenorhabdus bovienii TaxID=40576 RepID=UPI0023B23EF7|nr:hypothetical protein [Xenorhabdus bovienii]MDE9463077.1 hypothetical protein [Xenorhabdus bovienii]